MQGDHRAIKAFARECIERTLPRVERVRIDTLPTQGLEHPGTTANGDLPLGGIAAKQHGDFAEPARIDHLFDGVCTHG